MQIIFECGESIPLQVFTSEGSMYVRNISIGQEMNGVWVQNIPLQITVETQRDTIFTAGTTESLY